MLISFYTCYSCLTNKKLWLCHRLVCIDPWPSLQAKDLIRNYLVEARWLKECYMPTLEEYMSVSMVTGTYGLMTARSYVGRDDMVTEDSFKWVATYPPIVKASSTIVRLMDDIVSHKVRTYSIHILHACR